MTQKDMVYEIQMIVEGQWTNEIGESIEFDTEDAAWVAVAGLKTLGSEWQAAEYQVVEIQTEEVQA